MAAPFKVERMNEEAKKASSNQKQDFAEYMWMVDLENFDREVRSKIEEEDYIRSSIELLLDEEERDTVYFDPNRPSYPPQSNDVYFNKPQGQYNQIEYVYAPENIGYSMENLQIADFNQPPQYQQPQPVLGQQNCMGFPPNAMISYQPFLDSHHNGYLQGNDLHNGYFQSSVPVHDEKQSNHELDLQKATGLVSVFFI